MPYLATAPLQGTVRRRRRWRLPLLLAGTVFTVAGLTILIAVPVGQSAPENFTLANPSGSLFPVTQALTFPHAGTFDLSWQKLSGSTPTFQFTVLAPDGRTVYESNGTAGGSASVRVGDEGPYTFEIYDWLSGTVSVSGRLYFSAPLL